MDPAFEKAKSFYFFLDVSWLVVVYTLMVLRELCIFEWKHNHSFWTCFTRNDLWALGCTLYQMLSGFSPFKDTSEWLIFQRIIARDIRFPNYFSNEARDLIDQLLVSYNSSLIFTCILWFLLFSSPILHFVLYLKCILIYSHIHIPTVIKMDN